MNDFPNAGTVRSLSLESSPFGRILNGIKGQIQEAAEQGQGFVYRYLEPDEQLYYEELADFLRERGYEVSWNGACLWMEISW